MTEEKTSANGVVAKRRLNPSIDLPSYGTLEDAVSGKSPIETPLKNGWKMRADSAAAAALAAFYETEFKAEGFADVSIPQSLFLSDVEGMIEPPAPAGEKKPAPQMPALYYRCWFEQGELEKGADYILRLRSLAPFGELYLNGEPLGALADGFMVSEYHLNGLLKEGKNLLALKISAGPALAKSWDTREPYGILGDVALVRRGRNSVVDLYIKSMQTPLGEAQVECDVSFICGNGASSGELAFYVYKGNKQLLAESKPFRNAAARRLEVFRFHAAIKNPAEWSPESPELYRAVVAVKSENGELLDVRSCAFGINHIEIKTKKEDGREIPYLSANGKEIKFFGAEYYAYGGEKGYMRAREEIRADLERLKKNGFNAVRLVAPNEELLALCDEVGLFAVCECPLGLAKLTRRQRGANDPLRFGLARMATMVSTLKNHASAIMWSLGECPGYARATIQNITKSIDKTRPIVCDGDYSFTVSDLFAALDCSLGDLKNIAAGKAIFGAGLMPTLAYREMPFLLLGYSLKGEKTPSVAARYEVINASARLCGGFCERFDLGDEAFLKQMKTAFLKQPELPAEPRIEPQKTEKKKPVAAKK